MKTEAPVSPFLNKAQAAQFLGTSVFWIESLIKAGKLKVSRPSYKVLRINIKDIEKMMEATASVGEPSNEVDSPCGSSPCDCHNVNLNVLRELVRAGSPYSPAPARPTGSG
jgi:hypothetical protein